MRLLILSLGCIRMSYGLIVNNQNQNLQIDSMFRNHHLVFKQTYNVNFVGAPDGDLSTPITLPSIVNNTSVIAVFCENLNRRHVVFYRVENNGQQRLFGYFENGTTSYTVYAFNPVNPSQITENYGLTVYNGSGQPVFSSQFPYLKVVGYYNKTDTNIGVNEVTYIIPSGRRVAVAFGSFPHYKVGQGRTILTTGVRRTSNHYFIPQNLELVLRDTDIFSDHVQSNRAELLFIDVTGY